MHPVMLKSTPENRFDYIQRIGCWSKYGQSVIINVKYKPIIGLVKNRSENRSIYRTNKCPGNAPTITSPLIQYKFCISKFWHLLDILRVQSIIQVSSIWSLVWVRLRFSLMFNFSEPNPSNFALVDTMESRAYGDMINKLDMNRCGHFSAWKFQC